jgi:hypothetical protein
MLPKFVCAAVARLRRCLDLGARLAMSVVSEFGTRSAVRYRDAKRIN